MTKRRLEEELARYFDNPSYQAANPALLNPIDPEEDWGDTPPGLLHYHCRFHEALHNQQQELRRDKDICRGEERGED